MDDIDDDDEMDEFEQYAEAVFVALALRELGYIAWCSDLWTTKHSREAARRAVTC